MKYNPSEPRPYQRRGKAQPGRWEIDIRGVLDNGLTVTRERRVFPASPSAGRLGKRQAAAMALEEFERWNRCGQVLRPGQTPVLAQTGTLAPGRSPTFSQFAKDFMEMSASLNAGPRGPNSHATLSIKDNALRIHLLPAFGSMHMDKLTRRDVDRYVIEKTKAGRSMNSLRSDLTVLRRMLVVALQYDLITKIPDFRVPGPPNMGVTALEPDEIPRFLAEVRKMHLQHWSVLLELFLRTGLRRGEGLALYPADFDLEAAQPVVRVSRSWCEAGYGPPKGRKPRVVPLVTDLAERIDGFLSKRELSPRSTTQHLFSTDPNLARPLNPTSTKRAVLRVGQKANTQRLYPHMLRHTFGTECARRGVPVLTIMSWMGHAKVSTTMRYLHLVDPDHFKWVHLLG